MEGYGVVSILPVLVILLISFTTRKAIFALTCGFSVAILIIVKGDVSKLAETWFKYLYSSMANQMLQWLALVIVMFGILIVLLEKSGSINDFAEYIGNFIKTKKKALLTTIGLGIITFVDDYIITLTVGTTMKGITDKLGIPRIQLAYTVNSASTPICLLIPFSTWGIFYGTLLEKEGIVGIDGTGIGAYISAIPVLFYGWFAILVVLLQVLGIIPKIGMIKKDAKQTALTMNTLAKETTSASVQIDRNFKKTSNIKTYPWYFLIPLIVIIIVILCNELDILTGVSAGVISALLIYGVFKKLDFTQLLTCCYEGVVSMSGVIILLVLAFSVQMANVDLMLAEYVIQIISPIMKSSFLPMMVFVFCAAYSFATGCFWDLSAIIIPIVIPLSLSMGVDPILTAAAVFSGTAFGSNTCLYGDGLIMCSQACQVKTIDLMFATLPYASIAAIGSALSYLVAGFIM